jgi:hypothetical protein
MDAGTYCFSFFFCGIDESTNVACSFVEEAMRKREAELAEQEDENGTHDLLTGRLVVCFTLKFMLSLEFMLCYSCLCSSSIWIVFLCYLLWFFGSVVFVILCVLDQLVFCSSVLS